MIKNAIICDKCWGELLINGYKYHLCPKCANEMRQWINKCEKLVKENEKA